MFEDVDEEDEIVGWFEGFDDGLRFADMDVVVDVAMEGREVVFKRLDAIDATREVMIIFATIPEFEVFAAKNAVFAEAYTDVEYGLRV